MSRPENRENLQALADQVVWAVQTYVGGGVENIPQSMGTLYYVSDTDGLDANDGLNPSTAKKTIQDAIDTASDGDIIIVEAGTYDEPVDMDKEALEVRCEVGTVLVDTATGVQTLLISAASCLVTNLTIIQAGQIGVKITDSACYLHNVTVAASTVGFDVDSVSNTLEKCTSGSHSVTSFDISTATNRLIDCWSRGVGATRGFYLSNAAADGCLLENCVSSGNTVAGFEVVTGVSGCIFKDCTSGASDGVRTDPDGNNVWDDYSFDDIVYKEITLDGSHDYNIFKVTGSVEVLEIFGHVEEILVGLNTDVYFDLWSTAPASDPITKVTDSDLGAAVVGTIMIKTEDVGKAVTILSSATPTVSKAAIDKRNAVLTSDQDETTYIRFCVGGDNDTGGVMHFHCTWRPLTDSSSVEAV